MDLKLMKTRNIYFIFSTLMILFSLFSIFTKGFNLGIDFTGGNIYQMKFEKQVNKEAMDKTLKEMTSKYPSLKSNKVQYSEGNTVLLRTQIADEKEKSAILEDLKTKQGNYELIKADAVGAVIGNELAKNAVWALVLGAVLILIYITIRFEWIYALSSVLALLHDVLVTIGFVSFFQFEVDTPFIAAILTILGYSMNDTIVIFDRIRENDHKYSGKKPFADVIDESVNKVFMRSVYTSLTTLLALAALLIFGGSTLRTFNITLLVGIVYGTYSSIWLASPLVYLMRRFKKPPKQEKNGKKDRSMEKVVV
ncbi:MAG: protein translocase subunit SecF [Fusobacteriales bacterium]|jgi:preprotein translocase subunit SecF|nr:protein translocase subunit SecF [Fusobacteriales bacterium]